MANFQVYEAIYDKWIQLGGENFASPIMDETGTRMVLAGTIILQMVCPSIGLLLREPMQFTKK